MDECEMYQNKVINIKPQMILLILIFLMAGCLPSEIPQPELEEKIRRIENGLVLNESITERMEALSVPGVSIAVIDDFNLEWAKGYGVLERGGSETVTTDTLFQAASISKPVTAVTALHYVEQGVLNLDEDVNQRLVSWKIPENEFTKQADVTLYRLLGHRGGINQGLYKGYASGEEVPTMQQVLRGEPPATSPPVLVDRLPGSEGYYSNGGYLIVAQLLEDVLGKPFHEITEEALFLPIGMTSSTFEQPLPPELAGRAATAHGWDVETWKVSPGLVSPSKWHIYDVGMSGLWTTASDLALFCIEIMKAYTGESEAILSQEMTRFMLTPVTESTPLQEPFDAAQALGFSLMELGEDTWFIHFGGTFPGYISGIIASPERGFGIAVLTNSWTGYDLIWEIWYSIFYAYGILPTSGQVVGLGYGLLLTLAAFLFWPVSYIIQNRKSRPLEGEDTVRRPGKVAVFATVIIILTVIGILVMSYLYQGPLGGYLVPDRSTGYSPLVKGLFGLFFSTPIFLVVASLLVWKNKCWSSQKRIYFSLVVLGALVGIYLLRDLWGLMFWI
jgi:CubicO group peptidase (beta-lactamase class C family)